MEFRNWEDANDSWVFDVDETQFAKKDDDVWAAYHHVGACVMIFSHYKQRHVTIFDLTWPRNFYASLTRIVKKDTALVSFIWLQEQLK